MRKIFFALALAFCVSAAFAQNALVLAPLQNDGNIADGQIKSLARLLENALQRTKRFDIIDRTAVEDILREHGFQLSDLSDARKTVEMGKILNANYLVRPAVIPLASDLFLESRIVDTNTGKMLNSAEVKIKGDLGDAYEKLGAFAEKLTGGVSEGGIVPEEFVIDAGFITKYNGKGGAVVIPSQIKGQAVTGIKGHVFSGRNLTSLTIPSSITSIGDYAFEDNQLTSLSIPYGLTSIGEYAFSNNRLTSLSIPGSVTFIGAYAFYNNRLTSLTISGNGVSIGDYAFDTNSYTTKYNLTRVKIGRNAGMGHNSIHSNFDHYYTENRKRAGTYLYDEDDEEWEED